MPGMDDNPFLKNLLEQANEAKQAARAGQGLVPGAPGAIYDEALDNINVKLDHLAESTDTLRQENAAAAAMTASAIDDSTTWILTMGAFVRGEKGVWPRRLMYGVLGVLATSIFVEWAEGNGFDVLGAAHNYINEDVDRFIRGSVESLKNTGGTDSLRGQFFQSLNPQMPLIDSGEGTGSGEPTYCEPRVVSIDTNVPGAEFCFQVLQQTSRNVYEVMITPHGSPAEAINTLIRDGSDEALLGVVMGNINRYYALEPEMLYEFVLLDGREQELRRVKIFLSVEAQADGSQGLATKYDISDGRPG